MVNRYETVFILTPVLSEGQMKEAVDKFRSNITQHGGEMVHEENWGLRKFAYPIQKKSTGFYYLFEFSAEGSFIETFETEFRRDERVLRFLTFKMEKYAAEYAERRRNKMKSESKVEE